MIGRTLDRYVFIRQIGERGMGVVHHARDTELERDVAIKALPPVRVQLSDKRRTVAGIN